MPIQSIKYLTSIVPGAELPRENYPIFAFIGRSNAGKSSFLNCITNQKNLAREGATPGVTRKVNLYLVNKKYFFADLPGYGYAKMSRRDRNTLEKLIFWYLENTELKFKNIFLLLDSRVGPTNDDLDIIDFLNEKNLPLTIIASKIDKLKSSEKSTKLKTIATAFPDNKIIPFSSITAEGKKDVMKVMEF